MLLSFTWRLESYLSFLSDRCTCILSVYFYNVRCRRRQSNEGDGGFIKRLHIEVIGHPESGTSRIVVSCVLIDAKSRWNCVALLLQYINMMKNSRVELINQSINQFLNQSVYTVMVTYSQHNIIVKSSYKSKMFGN